MPYDSNGNATINRNRAVTGQTVQAAQVNTPFDDVQSMLSQVLLRSGVAPMTGPLNMNGFKVTGVPDATNPTDLVTLSQVQALLSDPWSFVPLGLLIGANAGWSGFSPPPTDRSYRYIILSAGQSSSSGQYNYGVITGESTTGIYPNASSTAVISLAGSPFNGATIRLINMERRFLRPGSPGALEESQNLSHSHGLSDPGHAHGINVTSAAQGRGDGTPAVLQAGTNGITGVSTTGITVQSSGGGESRPRNIGVDFYMRIL